MEKNVYICMIWAVIREGREVRSCLLHTCSLQTKDLMVEHSVKTINGVFAS